MFPPLNTVESCVGAPTNFETFSFLEKNPSANEKTDKSLGLEDIFPTIDISFVSSIKIFSLKQASILVPAVWDHRALVRIALLDMARKPKERPYHESNRQLKIITGMGNNSKDGEAVIKVRALELLLRYPLISHLIADFFFGTRVFSPQQRCYVAYEIDRGRYR